MERHRWLNYFFWPLIITIMIMCLNMSMVNFAQGIYPTWSSGYFLGAMLFTTIEAMYSYHLLKNSSGLDIDFTLKYRAAEWLMLVIILKIISLTAQSRAEIWTEFQTAWQDPTVLFPVPFIVMLILAFVSWAIATIAMMDFENLANPYGFGRTFL